MGLLDKMHLGGTAPKLKRSSDGTPEEITSLLNGQDTRHANTSAPRNASKAVATITAQVRDSCSHQYNHGVIMPSQLHVDGMSCSACSAAVERALLNVPGVQAATVALLQKSAQVVYDPTRLPKAQKLVHAIEDCGFEANLLTPTAPDSTQVRRSWISIEHMLHMLSTRIPSTGHRAVGAGHALRSLHQRGGDGAQERVRGVFSHGVAAHAQGGRRV